MAALAFPCFAQDLPNDIQVRLAGSPSIGKRLTTDVATAWAKKLGLGGIRMFVGKDPAEYEISASRTDTGKKLRISVSARGNLPGLEALLRGQADLWMAATQVTEADLEAMRKRNVANVPTLAELQTPGTENVVGLDAIAIVVHPGNPIKSLTIPQIRDVFQGKIANWSQVGGPNLPIKLYAMDAGAGYSGTFCSVVIGNPDISSCMSSLGRLAAPPFEFPDDLTEQIVKDPGGVSFVAFEDRHDTRAVAIATACDKAIGIDGFLIKTDEYPLTRRLYLYSNPGKPLTAASRAYLAYVLSGEGQTSVGMKGFATLIPSSAPEAYTATRLDSVSDTQDGGQTHIMPADIRGFEQAIDNAVRFSITFRFQAGTSALDSRAEADLERLAEAMALPENQGRPLVLIGFTNTIGDYIGNRTLSRERATEIRDRLNKQYGMKNVSAVGVGSAAAVACNLDESAAPLNQHVEVWLRERP
jgi:phosphate transport system substrate-binding protein